MSFIASPLFPATSQVIFVDIERTDAGNITFIVKTIDRKKLIQKFSEEIFTFIAKNQEQFSNANIMSICKYKMKSLMPLEIFIC